ncbi:MAG: hypothetical protein MJ241_06610 [Bacilli bacterium]|nr:hypothetical protein [Bacilli bacterium]
MKKKTKTLLVLALIAASFLTASCARRRKPSKDKCTGQCTAGLVVHTNNNNGNFRA